MKKFRKLSILVALLLVIVLTLTGISSIAGNDEILKGSITIEYKNEFTGEVVQSADSESNLELGEYTKEAPEINGFVSVPPSKQKVTLTESNKDVNITFTYYEEGQQMGTLIYKFMDIETGKEISQSVSTPNTNLLNLNEPENSIKEDGISYTFVSRKTDTTIASGSSTRIVTNYYKADTSLKVGEVTFVCRDESGKIISKTTKSNIALNTTKIYAPDIKDFKVDGEGFVEGNIFGESNKATLDFIYKYTGSAELPTKAKIKINMIDKDTNNVIETLETNINLGEEVDVPTKDLDGYTTITPTPKILITLCEMTGKEEVDVYYIKNKGKIVVNYIDGSGNNICDSEVKEGLIITTHQVVAKDIEGYTLKGEKIQNIPLSIDDFEKTVTFIYDKDVTVIDPVETYKIIIQCLDENNKIINSETIEKTSSGSYTIDAKSIDGYSLISDDKVTVEVNKDNPSRTVTFKYKLNETEVKNGTVVIKYLEKDSNASIREQDIQTKPIGRHSFKAPEIDGYTLEGSSSKEVEVTLDNLNHDIIFYYVKKEKPIEPPVVDETFNEGKLVVRYLDLQGNKLLQDEVKTGLKEGNYSYTAKGINGYTLKGSNKISFSINKSNPTKEINFTYANNKLNSSDDTTKLTILFIDDTTGETLMSSQTYNVLPGTYTYKANSINGYAVYGNDTQTISVDENSIGQIVFRYRKDARGVQAENTINNGYNTGTINIKYIDQSTGEEIAEIDTFKELTFREYTYSAKVIEGYDVVGSNEQSVTISSSKREMTVTFTYKKNSSKKKLKTSEDTKTKTKVIQEGTSTVKPVKEGNSLVLKKVLMVGCAILLVICIIIGVVASKKSSKSKEELDDFEL